MRGEILGKAKSVRELLKGVKYAIDYYQRDYKWQNKQLRELMDDLGSKFLEEHQPGQNRKDVSSRVRSRHASLACMRFCGSSMFASKYPLSMSVGVSDRPRSFMVSKIV